MRTAWNGLRMGATAPRAMPGAEAFSMAAPLLVDEDSERKAAAPAKHSPDHAKARDCDLCQQGQGFGMAP